MQIKIINVEKAKGIAAKTGKPYDYIDVTYKAGDKTESKKLFMNDPIGVQVMGFKNGDFVEMTQTKVGDFWNWTSVSLSTPQDIVNSAPAQTQGAGQQTPKTTYVPDDQKQLLIVRQNCVGNAVKFHEGVDSDEHAVLKTAAVFENYIFGRYVVPTSPDQHSPTTKTDFVDEDDSIPF
jgi:hypothetical protein